MGDFLTSKSTSRQEIDPTLAAESASLIGLLRMMMSEEPQYNRGVTIAGFTPTQEAAFNNQSTAAKAFGMAAPESTGLPKTTTSASGIEGYSIAPEVEASKNLLPESFKKMMEEWRTKAGTETPVQSFEDGGKK